MKKHILTYIVAGLLLVVFCALLFLFQVRQSEVAVVTFFGRPVREINTPGRVYFKAPWPIERVYKLDQRTQNFEDDKFDEVTNPEGYNLLVMTYAGWRISNPTNFFPRFGGGQMAEAEKSLKSLIRNAKSAVIGQRPLGDLINADPQKLKFGEVEKQMLEMVQQQVRTNGFGIEVQFLGIKKLGLPESVTTAVFGRMQSERGRLVSAIQSEGEAQAQNIRSSAERRAAELLASAEAQATEIRGKGEAEAAKSLAVFQLNPSLATFLFRLNALESSLKDRSTLIFDQGTPPFDLFRSPLGTNQPASRPSFRNAP